MTVKEIIERCRALEINEERCNTDEYGELVFCAKTKDAWSKALADSLGPAIKPSGTKPTHAHISLTQNYGGIRVNQTLFTKEIDKGILIAMFWPWEDGIHITLKIALVSESRSALKEKSLWSKLFGRISPSKPL